MAERVLEWAQYRVCASAWIEERLNRGPCFLVMAVNSIKCSIGAMLMVKCKFHLNALPEITDKVVSPASTTGEETAPNIARIRRVNLRIIYTKQIY